MITFLNNTISNRVQNRKRRKLNICNLFSIIIILSWNNNIYKILQDVQSGDNNRLKKSFIIHRVRSTKTGTAREIFKRDF